MPNPIVHAEIRSADPDATRAFFGQLFGWTFPEGAIPGYTYVDSGVPDALPAGISPLQGGSPIVTFFVGVDDIDAAVAEATRLGGRVVQEPVPGARRGVRADRRPGRSGRRAGPAGLSPAPAQRAKRTPGLSSPAGSSAALIRAHRGDLGRRAGQRQPARPWPARRRARR